MHRLAVVTISCSLYHTYVIIQREKATGQEISDALAITVNPCLAKLFHLPVVLLASQALLCDLLSFMTRNCQNEYKVNHQRLADLTHSLCPY